MLTPPPSHNLPPHTVSAIYQVLQTAGVSLVDLQEVAKLPGASLPPPPPGPPAPPAAPSNKPAPAPAQPVSLSETALLHSCGAQHLWTTSAMTTTYAEPGW